MRGEYSNGVEAIFKVNVSNVTLGINVEDSESVEEVEIWSLGKGDFSAFYLFFKRNLFSKGPHKFILLF